MEHEPMGRQPFTLQGLVSHHGGAANASKSRLLSALQIVLGEVEDAGDDRVLSSLSSVDGGFIRIEVKLMTTGVGPTMDPPLRCANMREGRREEVTHRLWHQFQLQGIS
jgi:hypothetical protein